MAIIDPGSEPQLKAGMSRQRIIKLANERTKNIAVDAQIDLDALFLETLQEFCLEHRWFWRKRSVAFHTESGNSRYDLTDPAKDAIDCAEIISVKYFREDGGFKVLDPVFGQDAQDSFLEKEIPGEPYAYFMVPGLAGTMQIVNQPNSAYRIRVSFWALPNTTSDQQNDNVPLVPGFHQHILVKGLVAKITGDPKDYAIYQAAVDKAGEIRDFALGKVREFSSNDEAIRSC